jgi:glycogen debranching enzyme
MRATYRVDLVNHVLIVLVNVLVKDTNYNFYYSLHPYITFTFLGQSLSFRGEKRERERARQREVFYVTTLSVANIIQCSVSDRLVWSSDGMLSTGEN